MEGEGVRDARGAHYGGFKTYLQILWHFSHLEVESLRTSILNLAKDFA